MTGPDDPDAELCLPELPEPSAPTVALRTRPIPTQPIPTSAGRSVSLRGRIPAAALARGTEPPAERLPPPPPHSAAVDFGAGAGIVIEVEGDRVTLSLPTGRVVGTRAQTRDLIDALLDALSH